MSLQRKKRHRVDFLGVRIPETIHSKQTLPHTTKCLRPPSQKDDNVCWCLLTSTDTNRQQVIFASLTRLLPPSLTKTTWTCTRASLEEGNKRIRVPRVSTHRRRHRTHLEVVDERLLVSDHCEGNLYPHPAPVVPWPSCCSWT